jgi:NADPH:quinone reductase-like Zn-dependent oxidoreductase
MRAITQDQYGSADVLHLPEVGKPEAGDDDVLVHVRAAAVHIGDWHMMTGSALPDAHHGFRVPRAQGACSGYGCRGPHRHVPRYRALRGPGEIQAGQTVLINGASGGVGLLAVAIAKSFGAEVTGVCSTTKADMLRSVGADHVVEYTAEDFTRSGHEYDLMLDMVGTRLLSQLRVLLTPRGTLVLVGGEGGDRLMGALRRSMRGLVTSPFVSQRLRPVLGAVNTQDLRFLTDLIEAGKVTPVIDRTYALSEVADAIRYLNSGHARGKIVISVHGHVSVQEGMSAAGVARAWSV